MKEKLHPRLKMARIRPKPSGLSELNGWFVIKGPVGRELRIISSDGDGWDHVSVSIVGTLETPTWDEMCFVKDMSFEPNEPAFQYHPPQSRYVNIHNGCLHLWRKQDESLPMPPLILV